MTQSKRTVWQHPAHRAGRAVGVIGSAMILTSFWRGGTALTIAGLVATLAAMALLLVKPVLPEDAYEQSQS